MIVKDCYKNSEKIIDLIKKEFIKKFDQEKYTLFSWGSVARREMGTYSDLDLIILSLDNNIDYNLIESFKKIIEKKLPNNYIDLLEVYTLKELNRISKIDGTDMQAFLFMKYEAGKRIKTKKKLDIIREILHIFCNLNYVYDDLFGSDNLKFGPYNIKYYNFAILLAKYFGCTECDTIASFNYLKDINKINKQKCKQYISNYKKLLYYRDIVQKSNKSSDCCFKEKNIIDYKSKKYCQEMKQDLFEINRSSKDMYENLTRIMFDILNNNLSKKEVKFLAKCINNKAPCSKKLNILLYKNKEIIMMFLSYYLCDSKLLETIRMKNEKKWYVLYGIANNKYTSVDTLYKLIDYRQIKNKNLKNLYTDFSWRNIYLYVAKNPASNQKIKNYILNYENSRPMDINAAKKIKCH